MKKKQKKTCLHQNHLDLGAKIVDFAGFDMPVLYSKILEEHHAVRTHVGIFDVSHMGEFLVNGPDSLDFLQKITTNDISKLFPKKIQYSCFPNEKGGIVDDLLVYCLGENEYMLVVNGANIDKDWNWIVAQKADFDVQLENISDEMALIAVQGPKAVEIVQLVTNIDVGKIPYYHFERGMVANVPNLIVSATGYTGEKGFELYVPNYLAPDLWEIFLKKGAQPCGLAARDTLRLEMGYCLYGNDIDDSTSPLEANLGWITKFKKDFIGKPVLEQQKKKGVTQKLVGFELLEKGIPRKDYEILDLEGKKIGRVTSGTQSPSLEKPIGMGYVQKEFAEIGSEILIQIRKKQVKAKIVRLPFYKSDL